jgi:hypothetical protein
VKRYAALWPYLQWFLFVLGIAYCAAVIWGGLDYGGEPWRIGDAGAWYYTDTPYDWSDRPSGVAQFRYSPAFLWITEPLRWLPLEVYVVAWFGLHIAALLWLRAAWMLAIPFVADDVIRGNITVFLAVAVVVAMRWGGAWAFIALTKVAPAAAIGWHVARREWGYLAWATAVTLAIVAAGAGVEPQLWMEWLKSLTIGEATYEAVHPLGPIWFRIIITFAVSLYAGWSHRVWLVPIAMMAGVPGLWPYNLALIAAIPLLANQPVVKRLRADEARHRAGLGSHGAD